MTFKHGHSSSVSDNGDLSPNSPSDAEPSSNDGYVYNFMCACECFDPNIRHSVTRTGSNNSVQPHTLALNLNSRTGPSSYVSYFCFCCQPTSELTRCARRDVDDSDAEYVNTIIP